MEHEISDKLLEISETSISFNSEFSDTKISEEILDEVKHSNLLIIPYKQFRGNNGFFFPETTLEFLDFLRENAPEEITPDIMASDEEFNQLELHSALITVASFIVKIVALPIAINLVSDFLHDLCQKHNRKPDELSAEVNIYVDMKDKSTKISYKGPVTGIKDTLEGAAKQLQSTGNNDDIRNS